MPKILQEIPTTGTAKHYDQIGFKTREGVVEYVESRSSNPTKRNAGVIPLFESVFTDGQFADYESEVKKSSEGEKAGSDSTKLAKVYRDWRTYQFSDHYPMWARLHTDDSEDYLKRMAGV